MELLVLLLAFAGIGYLVGTSKLDSRAGQATEKLAKTSQKSVGRMREGWNTTFARGGFSHEFRAWIIQNTPAIVPESFQTWLCELSDSELRAFVKSLANYSHGLGYNLTELVEGGLDNDPRMRQIFVEAITVYSSAYRKARQIHRESEAAVLPEEPSAETGDGKIQAEKAPSRRKAENNHEAQEPAAAD